MADAPGPRGPDSRAEDGPGAAGEQPGSGPEPAQTPPPSYYVADIALVGVCAWFLFSDYSASLAGEVKLEARTWTFMLNLTCAFVLVHRLLSFAQRSTARPQMARVLGIFKWATVIVLPLAVAAHLEGMAQVAHKAKLDEYVETVRQRTDAAMARGGAVGPGDLDGLTSPYLSELTVRHDTGEFLVQVSLPAFDIDGYTGHYSSTERRWHIHHNDLEPDSTVSFDAAGPLITCTPVADRLACN